MSVSGSSLLAQGEMSVKPIYSINNVGYYILYTRHYLGPTCTWVQQLKSAKILVLEIRIAIIHISCHAIKPVTFMFQQQVFFSFQI